jgi:hypothetical protein
MAKKTLVVGLLLILVAIYVSAEGNASDKSGWQAQPKLAEEMSKRQSDIIYLEEKVPAYTLPDPLLLSDGSKVTDAQTWQSKRRPEILELFCANVYGRAPIGRPQDMTFEVFDLNREALGGLATRKQVTVNFTGSKDGPSMDILIYLPNGAKTQIPTFLILNFGGNHTIHPDPAIKLSKGWMRGGGKGVVDNLATEETRGRDYSSYPMEKILGRGYGLATIYYGDIDPDFDDGFKNGVHAAFDKPTDGNRPADAWGSISVWAWGLSRAMDYLETDKNIDNKRAVGRRKR